MKVSDLCICDVAACTSETSLARAGALMRKYDVGSIPVVDRNDRVIGMVTDRDVALELTRRNAPPSEIFVDEIMSDRVAACSAEDDVRDALRLMARHKVRRLPIVDEDDRLQGILSIDDIVCHAAKGRNGRDIPYEDVIETFCEIVEDYSVETGERAGRRESTVGGRTAGSRSRTRYRKETPEFEGERASRSRIVRQKDEPVGRARRSERSK